VGGLSVYLFMGMLAIEIEIKIEMSVDSCGREFDLDTENWLS
jgi:hypothetical protein